MKIVNYGDPFTKRITLRLTDLQYNHLLKVSSLIGTSPSDYIRYLITQSALNYGTEDMFYFGDGEGTSDENVKTCSNDNV